MLLRQNVKLIVVGGGNDFAFPLYQSLSKIHSIINISAVDNRFDFGKIDSDYSVQVFDQLGRLVSHFEMSNENSFSLEKSQIGAGMFFVNVLFEDERIAPLARKIVFN